MVLLTLNYVPGREIDALGMVKGNVVQSKNIGKDLLAGFRKTSPAEKSKAIRKCWQKLVTSPLCE